MTDPRPVIRPATRADQTAVTAVRRMSWFAPYDGIIDRAITDRATRNILAGLGDVEELRYARDL